MNPNSGSIHPLLDDDEIRREAQRLRVNPDPARLKVLRKALSAEKAAREKWPVFQVGDTIRLKLPRHREKIPVRVLSINAQLDTITVQSVYMARKLEVQTADSLNQIAAALETGPDAWVISHPEEGVLVWTCGTDREEVIQEFLAGAMLQPKEWNHPATGATWKQARELGYEVCPAAVLLVGEKAGV